MNLVKTFSFWLSSCLSKLNEPFVIQDILSKLEILLGINSETFEAFNNIISGELLKHSKIAPKKFKVHWKYVASRLKLFLCSPVCEQCHETMVRKIPKDLKKINGTSKLHHGVNLQRQTWMDTIPLCSECNSFLFYEDIYFECLKCGPEGYKRFVKGGKLFNVVHDNGNSLCLSCLKSFH